MFGDRTWVHNKKGENDVENPIQTATGLLWDLERVTLVSQRQGCHRFGLGQAHWKEYNERNNVLQSSLGNLHMVELALRSTFKSVWCSKGHPRPVYYASTHQCWTNHPAPPSSCHSSLAFPIQLCDPWLLAATQEYQGHFLHQLIPLWKHYLWVIWPSGEPTPNNQALSLMMEDKSQWFQFKTTGVTSKWNTVQGLKLPGKVYLVGLLET